MYNLIALVDPLPFDTSLRIAFSGIGGKTFDTVSRGLLCFVECKKVEVRGIEGRVFAVREAPLSLLAQHRLLFLLCDLLLPRQATAFNLANRCCPINPKVAVLVKAFLAHSKKTT